MEFLCWRLRRDRRLNEQSKIELYLAQILTMLEAVNSKNPSNAKLEKHILKFKPPGEVKAEDKEKKAETSKATWGLLVNDNARHTRTSVNNRP